jgi:hypothetical protein
MKAAAVFRSLIDIRSLCAAALLLITGCAPAIIRETVPERGSAAATHGDGVIIRSVNFDCSAYILPDSSGFGVAPSSGSDTYAIIIANRSANILPEASIALMTAAEPLPGAILSRRRVHSEIIRITDLPANSVPYRDCHILPYDTVAYCVALPRVAGTERFTIRVSVRDGGGEKNVDFRYRRREYRRHQDGVIQ